MSFYSNMAASALRLLSLRGQTVPFRRYAQTLDPVTGTVSAVSYTSGALQCVVLPMSDAPGGMMDDSLTEVMKVKRTRYLIVARDPAVSPIAPANGDTLILESSYWRIHEASRLAPDGTEILFYITAIEEAIIP